MIKTIPIDTGERIEVYIDKNLLLISNGVDTTDDEECNAAMNGVLSMILAHAAAGVDIESDEYVRGVNEAIESINNHYGV